MRTPCPQDDAALEALRSDNARQEVQQLQVVLLLHHSCALKHSGRTVLLPCT